MFGTTTSDLIAEMLIDQQTLTADQIKIGLQAQGLKLSIQAVYLELRKLRKNAIVVKLGEQYLIRTSALFFMKNRIENSLNQLVKSMVSPSYSDTLSIQKKVKLTSLVDLHRFWSSLVLALVLESPGGVYFEWVPHAWFVLSDIDVESQVFAQHQELRIPYYLLIGGDSFLDKKYAEERRHVHGRTLFAECPVPSLARKYISVYRDYLVIITVDKDISNAVDELFTQTLNSSSPALKKASNILSKKGKITVEWRKDPEKASKLQDQMRSIFFPEERKSA